MMAPFGRTLGVLFYKRYQTRNSQKMARIEGNMKENESEQMSSPSTGHQASTSPLRKAIGVLLTIVGVFSLFLVFPALMMVSIIKALFFSIPATLPLFIGYSLIVKRRLKDALLSWIAYTSFVLLTMIFVLPLICQVLSACFIGVAFASFVQWGRSKHRQQLEKRGIHNEKD
jgi:hypothetical protein